MTDLIDIARVELDASKVEDVTQLVPDEVLIAGLVQQQKAGTLNFKTMPKPQIKSAIQALARTFAVLAKMADDPAQLDEIAAALASVTL